MSIEAAEIVVTESDIDLRAIEADIAAIVDRELGDIAGLTERVIAGELSTF
jgi:S-adenosylmethionine synthetase